MASWASYDLLYIGEGSGTRVHRFDPVSRVHLGSFSVSHSRFVAAHINSPYVMSGTTTAIGVYNGASGEHVNTTNAYGDFGTMTPTGTLLAFSSATTFREVTLPNGTVQIVSALSTISEARGIVAVGTNKWVVGRGASGDLILNCYSNSGATLLSSAVVLANASLPANVATAGMGVSVSSSGVTQLWFTLRTSAGDVQLRRYSLSGTSATLSDSTTLTGFSTLNAGTTQAVLGGHGNSAFVVGADAANPNLTRIMHLSANSTSTLTIANYTTSAFTVNSSTDWTAANVVAPEPGSILALGAGLFLVLRRRVPAKR
ncbi:MAG: PEP-CTERM sorting domain-containing protein [Chthonomonas sp.]|nr:PEP-CTERM sorting domain-containing protein [Chthonomonas sp.]